AAVTAAPGEYTLSTTCTIKVTARESGSGASGFSWGRTMAVGPDPFLRGSSDAVTLAEHRITLSTPVTIISRSADTVELVQTSSVTEAVRQALQVNIADEPAMSYQPGGRRASISVGVLPVDIAYDVLIRGGGR